MRAPKKVYYVHAKGASKAWQKGGGLLTRLAAAEDRCKTIVTRGGQPTLYVGTVTWEEIPLSEFAQRVL